MKKISLVLLCIFVIIINILSKLPLLILLQTRLKLSYKNIRELYATKGPFLLLPNHVSQWDPFILSFAILRPIHWVASDGAFRDFTFKFLLYLSGTIAKIKGQSDMMTIQKVKESFIMRHSAGIFPEGEQTWDGQTLPLLPSTAKLIRFLKVPVVVPLIKGGFLSKPRWAWSMRKCRVEVHFKRIISTEEIQTMKLSEIEERLNQFLVHDEYAWQRTNRVPIISQKRAECLELAHFMCPACVQMGTLRSSGNNVTCTCGYTVHVDCYGFFQYPASGPSFDSPREWMLWQRSVLTAGLRKALDAMLEIEDSDPVLLCDDDITLEKTEHTAKSMRTVLKGEARLYANRIEVGNPNGENIVFPFREITAVNTFKQQKFEFRHKKNQYRFTMPNRSISGYKWEIAYKDLQEILHSQEI